MTATDQPLPALVHVLENALNLQRHSAGFGRDTPLPVAIVGLDSTAVNARIERPEDFLGMCLDGSEIDGACFATVGTPLDLIAAKWKLAT